MEPRTEPRPMALVQSRSDGRRLGRFRVTRTRPAREGDAGSRSARRGCGSRAATRGHLLRLTRKRTTRSRRVQAELSPDTPSGSATAAVAPLPAGEFSPPRSLSLSTTTSSPTIRTTRSTWESTTLAESTFRLGKARPCGGCRHAARQPCFVEVDHESFGTTQDEVARMYETLGCAA